VDSRQITYFLAVVDHGGITRAAAALYVAQPTLTQGIQALEASLGVELFYRRPRGVELTAAGFAFVEPARRVRRALAELESTAKLNLELELGSLDLVALPDLAVDPLVPLIAAFRRLCPQVRVNVLDIDPASSVPGMLRRGRAEIGLTSLPIHEPGIDGFQIGVRRLALVQPPASATAPPVAELHALAGVPLVVGRLGSVTRDSVEEAVRAAGATIRVAVEVDHEEQIRDLVLAGAGSALLPELVAQDARRLGAVVRATSPAIEQEIGLVFRNGRHSPPAGAFLHYARSGGGRRAGPAPA
jgi:DNA-binding transcriptional LysR family regulator